MSSSGQDINTLRTWLKDQIIGQSQLLDRLLIALLADGHLLVEGAPGLAKTKAISTLSQGLEADFQRVQFTPDLLPGDITGTDIFRPQTGVFEFQKGPLFHNLVLADEINRAPAKVQSALLEAMAERQVSVGSNTFKLPELFLVMATQNPLEQEGTYPLPEAQLDRFLMHVIVDYPDAVAELEILRLVREENKNLHHQPPAPLSQESLFAARQEILNLAMNENVEQYIVELIISTRTSNSPNEQLNQWIEYGASPRGSIALERCARAHAWLNGKDYVSPDDVQAIAHDVLRHRLIISYEAEANGVTTDQVIDELLALVPAA